MINITPSQNVGIEMPKSPPTMVRLSTIVRERTAETVPAAIPSGIATIIEPSASSSVAGNLDRISAVTLDPVRYDRPRFPFTAPASQRQYWTGQESVRPISRRTRCSDSGDACSPSRSSAGSPPADRTITNVSIETSRRLGPKISTRRARYRTTEPDLSGRAVRERPARPAPSADLHAADHHVAQRSHEQPLDVRLRPHGARRVPERHERRILEDQLLRLEIHLPPLLRIPLHLRVFVQLVHLGVLV